MQPPQPTLYDEVPYDSKAFAETHPDRLATVAILFGLTPPPVERCRVLELGCADGSNLVPMALSLPDSSFVGVDLSQRQIADAEKLADACGIKNAAFSGRSILDISEADGTFDYIICHGVYSWVPPEVREHILTICKRNLASNGVAYVSYNTYPGWHVRRMVRDLMCYHGKRVSDPREQVKQARAFLEFLGKAVVVEPNHTYGATIRGAVEALKDRSDSYLLHEYLEEHNEPCYFHEFAERAERHDLQYLGDAHVGTMTMNKLPPDVQQTLGRLASNFVQLEQYLDFLQNRPFRRSLLCHAGQPVNHHGLKPDVLARLFISSLAKPVSPRPNVQSTDAEEFRMPEGPGLATREPLLKAALLHLAEISPRGIPLPELFAAARERSALPDGQEPPGPRTEDFLGARILNYYLSGIVHLHTYLPRCTLTVSARPVASPLVRLQAQQGRRVTNLRHELVEVSDMARHLLTRLDGSQGREQLLQSLLELLGRGNLRIEKQGQVLTHPDAVRGELGPALDQTLGLLARSGCLLA